MVLSKTLAVTIIPYQTVMSKHNNIVTAAPYFYCRQMYTVPTIVVSPSDRRGCPTRVSFPP